MKAISFNPSFALRALTQAAFALSLILFISFWVYPQDKPEGVPSEVPDASSSNSQQVLNYRGFFEIEIFQLKNGISSIESLITKLNGYIQEIRVDTITFRVPKNLLQDALKQIRGLGHVINETLESNDVAAELTEWMSKQKSYLEILEQYYLLLNQAANVNEALLVEQEITQQTNGLEQVKGKIKYLAHNHQWITFTVHFLVKTRFTLDRANPFSWIDGIGLESLLHVN